MYNSCLIVVLFVKQYKGFKRRWCTREEANHAYSGWLDDDEPSSWCAYRIIDIGCRTGE